MYIIAHRVCRIAVLAAITALSFCALCKPTSAQTADVSQSTPLGRIAAGSQLSVSLVLPLRNQTVLGDLARRLYDPQDPLYGQYLTPRQFADRFGPTEADVAAVIAFARSAGLTVADVSSNRTVVHLAGDSAAIEAAFGVRMLSYQRADGTVFHAPDRQPVLPDALASRVVGVIGLDNSFRPRRFSRFRPYMPAMANGAFQRDSLFFTGLGALAPKDTQSVYNLPKADGAGQTLGLFETDGWTSSDITQFETQYGLPTLSPTLVSVDGGTGAPMTSDGAGETTLDIDMELELAPNASAVLVYDSPGVNYGQEAIDILNQMATDDRATVISSSIGGSEQDQSLSFILAEYQAFVQFACQGQTMCAAGGDSGAYNDQGNFPNTPTVSDPASDPFVLAVGGTELNDTSAIKYQSESSWVDPSDHSRGPDGTGGGGGISVVWALPSFQIGSFDTSVNPQGSTTMRNIPDVSLFGDFDEGGYSIYFTDPTTGIPNWYIANGTSASSPLWASFLANVNQRRAKNGLKNIGFASPAIYAIAEQPAKYAKDFHDIADGSNNLLYIAVSGFDNSTGWGSFNGANLLTDLGTIDKTAVPTAFVANPNPLPAGTTTTAVVTLSKAAPAVGARVKITLNGTTVKSVTIPSGKTGLSFPIAIAASTAPGTYTYVATYNGVSVSAEIFVRPKIKLTKLTLSPKSMASGSSTTITITLSAPAPSAGAPINVLFAGSSIGTITAPGGATSVSFGLSVSATPGNYAVSAKYDGSTVTATLTITS